MRMIIGTLALSALVGCASQDDVALEHRSLQEVQSRGIALNESGDVANVGMSGTTCDFQTDVGVIQNDFDYGPMSEVVVDGGVSPDLGTVNIVLLPDGIGVTTPDGFTTQSEIPVTGVLDGAALDAGVVAVSSSADGCSVSWHSFEGGVTSSVDLGFDCATAAITADDSTGAAFVSTSEGVHKVLADGTVLRIDSAANALVAWDASADALYVATPGTDVVHAFEADGAVRWESTVGGEVSALSEMGQTGQVALSITTPSAGEFVVLNGLSGIQTSDLATPSAASELAVSGNGQVLAVSLASAVHYFDITAQ